jgi:hypothetical protein
MKIDTAHIESLGPCENRLENWLKHYNDFSGSLFEFLNLSELSHEDKLWIFVRSIDKNSLPSFTADIAELTLHLYETKWPNDTRPRLAIEAARAGTASQDPTSASYVAGFSANVVACSANVAAYAAATPDTKDKQLEVMKKYASMNKDIK